MKKITLRKIIERVCLANSSISRFKTPTESIAVFDANIANAIQEISQLHCSKRRKVEAIINKTQRQAKPRIWNDDMRDWCVACIMDEVGIA